MGQRAGRHGVKIVWMRCKRRGDAGRKQQDMQKRGMIHRDSTWPVLSAPRRGTGWGRQMFAVGDAALGGRGPWGMRAERRTYVPRVAPRDVRAESMCACETHMRRETRMHEELPVSCLTCMPLPRHATRERRLTRSVSN